jgi:hypothetical protein
LVRTKVFWNHSRDMTHGCSWLPSIVFLLTRWMLLLSLLNNTWRPQHALDDQKQMVCLARIFKAKSSMNSILTSWLSADHCSKFSFYCLLLYTSSLIPDRILLHSLSLFDHSAMLSLFPLILIFHWWSLSLWTHSITIHFHWNNTAILILSFCYLLGSAFCPWHHSGSLLISTLHHKKLMDHVFAISTQRHPSASRVSLLRTRIVLNNRSSKENYQGLEFIYKTTMTVKSVTECQGFRLTMRSAQS